MRKLATVRIIDEIKSIPDADAIEVATVGGWNVVVKKGEYKTGDVVVYLEIDSWVPNEIAPFLSKGQEPREYNGVKGERLKTIKLRGQLSQGLILPVSTVVGVGISGVVGEDVTEFLNVQKWEPPIPAQLAGKIRGMFPDFIPRTDQERIQNLTNEFQQWKNNPELTWEVSEKLDGSSMTVYVNGEDSGVCSRNLNLYEEDSNTLWSVAIRESLIEKIRSTNKNYAFQGELIGEGIQGNPYKIKGQDFYLFDVYDIDNRSYLLPQQRQELAKELSVKHVPVFENSTLENDVPSLLTKAESKSMLCSSAEREGLVYKCCQINASFKVISNKFLFKNNG
jgi:RNA ligase (TIGR02306 family)